MIDMKVLSSPHSDECNEHNFYKVEETHTGYQSCPKDRSLCMNAHLPLCAETNRFIEHFDKNNPCRVSTRSRPLLREQFDCEDFLPSNQSLKNRYSSSKYFQEITPAFKKRRSLLNKDEIGSSLSKVKYTRRRSYNLANRHSEIFSKESKSLISMTMINQYYSQLILFCPSYLEWLTILLKCLCTNMKSFSI